MLALTHCHSKDRKRQKDLQKQRCSLVSMISMSFVQAQLPL